MILKLSSEDVKKIRGKTEMTQKEFSAAFGINLNTLRHWERGDREPTGASVVLLNLIKKAPKEIYSILDNSEERKVNNSENKDTLKKIMIEGRFPTFSDLEGSKFKNIDKVILALISANGFPYEQVNSEKEPIEFYAGHEHDSLSLVLTYSTDKSLLDGDFKKIIEKTYLVIYAIENELSEAMYLPHDMRQRRVNTVIDSIGVDASFYSTVLKNW